MVGHHNFYLFLILNQNKDISLGKVYCPLPLRQGIYIMNTCTDMMFVPVSHFPYAIGIAISVLNETHESCIQMNHEFHTNNLNDEYLQIVANFVADG